MNAIGTISEKYFCKTLESFGYHDETIDPYQQSVSLLSTLVEKGSELTEEDKKSILFTRRKVTFKRFNNSIPITEVWKKIFMEITSCRKFLEYSKKEIIDLNEIIDNLITELVPADFDLTVDIELFKKLVYEAEHQVYLSLVSSIYLLFHIFFLTFLFIYCDATA